MNLSGQTWVAPRCPEERQKMDSYRPATFASWAVPWLRDLVHNPVPKLGMGALVAALAQFQDVLWLPVAFAVGAWFCDFSVGALRALADPEVELSSEKAWRGIAKGLVIPILLVMAAIIEAATFWTIGWQPGGKLVGVVAVAVVWEEALSVQRNGQHFIRSLQFRVSSLPWMRTEEKDDEDAPQEPR